MKSDQWSLRSLAAVAVAGMLAGCAGGASMPAASTNALSSMASRAPSASASIQPAKCKSDHGVSVSPCSINLSLSNPDENVTTKGPKGGTFSYNDAACVKNDIATISGSGNSYNADWGSKSGSCTAIFTDKNSQGKKIGTAKLKITNKA
ncbi:MAG: hypothetical protein WB687_08205 [Candidatus Cybelea sp.]